MSDEEYQGCTYTCSFYIVLFTMSNLNLETKNKDCVNNVFGNKNGTLAVQMLVHPTIILRRLANAPTTVLNVDRIYTWQT